MVSRSKITAQGQISVPAEVRRRLGVGPGSVLAWDATKDGYVVKKAGGSTFEDVHRALGFTTPPRRRSLAELEEGIRAHMRRKHGSRARG